MMRFLYSRLEETGLLSGLVVVLMLTWTQAATAGNYADFNGETPVSKWIFHDNKATASSFSVVNGELACEFSGDTGETVNTYAGARLAELPATAAGLLVDARATAATGTCESGLMGSLLTSANHTLNFYVFLRGASGTIVWGYEELDEDDKTVTEFSHEIQATVLNSDFVLGLHYDSTYLRWGVRHPGSPEWSISQIPHQSTISSLEFFELRSRRPASCTTLFDNVRTLE